MGILRLHVLAYIVKDNYVSRVLASPQSQPPSYIHTPVSVFHVSSLSFSQGKHEFVANFLLQNVIIIGESDAYCALLL